jgi:hypothetical protein
MKILKHARDNAHELDAPVQGPLLGTASVLAYL